MSRQNRRKSRWSRYSEGRQLWNTFLGKKIAADFLLTYNQKYVILIGKNKPILYGGFMKKLMVVLLLLLVAAGVFANGGQEKLVVLRPSNPVRGDVEVFAWAEEMVKERFPETVIEFKQVDLSTGSAITMDTLIATGNPPDVYVDSMVRLSRYITPDFALPLGDIADPFTDVEPFTREGEVLALPTWGEAQGMAINLDLMEKVGYEVPENWTLSDFFEMAEMVKNYSDETGEEVYATGMFAGNQSGDYLWMNWFATFGVDLYSDNYTESTQVDGGAEVWNFFRMLQEKGYIPPNSSQLVDDDYVIQWASGMFAATPFFESWTAPYFDSIIEQGLIEEPFDYKYVSFPNDAPPCTNFVGVIINKDTDMPEVAKEYVRQFVSEYIMGLHVKYASSVPYRPVGVESDNPRVKEIAEIASDGTYDLGVTNNWFTEVRAEGFPILQQVLDGEMEGEEAAKLYTKRVNEIIQ